MDKISAVIVDNDKVTTQALDNKLEIQNDFALQAICDEYTQVLETINRCQPDVIFIDIAMPGLNGLDILESFSVGNTVQPLVVCVTANQEYAAKAFDCHALDYLLKPFTMQRLESCLTKIRFATQHLKLQHQHHELDTLLSRKTGKSLSGFMNTLAQPGQISKDQLEHTIAVKSGTEWLNVCLDDIHWIEAAGDYVCIHMEQDNHIIRSTLTGLHAELCHSRFVRFNRSSVVNKAKVIRFIPNSNGEYTAELVNGDKVKVSRRYKLGIAELCPSHKDKLIGIFPD